jgi:hypothetical protein
LRLFCFFGVSGRKDGEFAVVEILPTTNIPLEEGDNHGVSAMVNWVRAI